VGTKRRASSAAFPRRSVATRIMDDYKTVTEIVRKIIPFLSQKGIPLTPKNYRIWFEYFRGIMPDIKETLDDMLDKRIPFTAEKNEELYVRFFERDIEKENTEKQLIEITASESIRKRIEDSIVKAIKDIFLSSETVGSYNEILHRHFKNVSDVKDINEIKFIVSSLIKETSETITSNSKTHEELQKTVKELEDVKRSLNDVQIKARTDSLTGLNNRLAFDEKIKEEMERFKRYKIPCSIAMIDIDHFKKLNDTYGHTVGDKALVHVCKELVKNLRKIDFASRYGGEEFAVILPSTAINDAVIVIEKIRQEIFDTEFLIKDKSAEITVSGGVREFHDGDTIAQVIEKADQALYLAKNSGRNQVKVSS
jgi:diguanylate cyclase